MRRAWGCLIRKQWLFLYPLTLSIVSVLAFFAVYAAQGGKLGWTAFFTTEFDQTQYLREQFVTGLSLTSRLWVPVAALVAYCLICALVQAPFYRAIVGHRYPLKPRSWREASRLFLFYLLLNLVTRIPSLAAPTADLVSLVVSVVLLAIVIAVVFADYVIVFEDVGPIRGVRRSLRLVKHRLGLVLVITLVLQLVLEGVSLLYGLYYRDGGEVFYLLPVSQILVETLVYLFANILLVFLYEEIRRQSPARAEL
jgi:hypothetical protein